MFEFSFIVLRSFLYNYITMYNNQIASTVDKFGYSATIYSEFADGRSGARAAYS